jgi:hypothetical protein
MWAYGLHSPAKPSRRPSSSWAAILPRSDLHFFRSFVLVNLQPSLWPPPAQIGPVSSPDRPRLRRSILLQHRLDPYHPQIGLVFTNRSSPLFFSDPSRFIHLSDSSSWSVSVGLVHHLICDVLQFRSTSPSVKLVLLFPIGIVHSHRPRETSIFLDQIRRQANQATSV